MCVCVCVCVYVCNASYNFCDIPILQQTNFHLCKPRYRKMITSINSFIDNDNVQVFLYFSLLQDVFICTNKGKNITKITIRLTIPILRIHI